jgi:hypothetical protein
MSVFSSSPLRRLWLAPQTTFNAVPNSTGTWTDTGATMNPYTNANIQRMVGLIDADYKTGKASKLAGIAGRASAKGSFLIPLVLSGAAGTAPMAGLLLKNAFGVETVSEDTSVTYSQSDAAVAAFIAALYNESDSGCTDQFAYGGVVTDFTLNLGGDGYLSIDANVDFVYDLESDNFANEDTAGKAGLTTFPAEPSSPAFTGNIVPSFLSSSITIGGNALPEFVSAQIKVTTGRVLRYDGGKYATAIVQGRRMAVLQSIKLADSNSSALTAVKNLAASKTASDVIAALGGAAGYTATLTAKSVQLGNASFVENGAGLDIQFEDSPAHASAVGNTDEITLALT